MQHLEEAKKLEKFVLKVFDKYHNCTNEYSETEALELLSQLPNPAGIKDDDDEDQFTLLHHACHNGWYKVAKLLIERFKCDPNCTNADGSIPLYQACRSGNLDLVKYLIQDKQCDPNNKNSRGYTPVHNAALGGHFNVIKFLIECCEIISTLTTNTGWTPLHSACSEGYLDVAKYLIEKQLCNPGCITKDCKTPLHSACLKGNLDIVRYLIKEQQCDPGCRMNGGWTPLHYACRGGYLNVAKYLIEEQHIDPSIKSDNCWTPLHSACLKGHVIVVKYLCEEQQCDPGSRKNGGSTPLHYASEGGYLNVVKYLIEEQHIDPSIKSDNCWTPLHSACLKGHVNVVKYLIEKQQCDPSSGRNGGWTPLHYASEGGYLNVVEYLIEEQHINPSIKSDNCWIPLYSACLKGHLNLVKYLIENQQCDPGSKINDGGWTPLHYSCEGGHLNVAKYLIEEQHIDPSIKNDNYQTPLHSACLKGHISVVKYLIEKQQCDPINRMSGGWTPLQCACKRGHLNVVKYLIEEQCIDPSTKQDDCQTPLYVAYSKFTKYLIEEQQCDSACRMNGGWTPLHSACEKGHLNVAIYLVEEQNCDPMCLTRHMWTPLHSASRYGNLDMIKYLIQEQQCDPNCRTLKGNTPLHLACRHQHFDVVVYLVTECIGDGLLSLLYYGDSLIKETLKGGSDDILFFLMSQGLQLTSKSGQIDVHKRLVQPALKVFVLGNAMSGKSTLVKALKLYLVDSDWFSFNKIFYPKVAGVEPHTAGIIPYLVHSPNFGRIILYDFAGQHEHYSSSHAAILEKLRCAHSDLVFIVVDIRRPREQLVKELRYWDSFVSNQYGQENPPIIVIGSHFDVAKLQGAETLSQALSEVPHLNTFITLDCTRKSSPGLTEIYKQISAYSKRHHEIFNVSVQVHFLNRLLQEKFEDKIACQFYEVRGLIAHEDNAALRRNSLLPFSTDSLSNQLSKLSEHGEFLYIEDSMDTEQSWVIFKKEILLSELNGSIFAPKEFESVYKDLSSTGVVALSKIIEAFPHYKHKMLMSFMKTLDFCHEIDKSDISIINSSDGGDQQILEHEQYYFFPALVSTEKNIKNCQGITKMSYKFGWCLYCNGNIFFTSRFLQVLLLRLAFIFALPEVSSTNEENTLSVERRKCNIWKNGIHWQNMDGVETIVEVVEQNTAVVLIMGCLEGSQIKCIQQRSAVIETILSAKEKYSAAVDAKESFLHPDELGSYPLREVQSLFTFPLDGLKVAIKERREALTNKVGQRQEMMNTGILLFFEPYTCLTEEMISSLIERSDHGKVFEDSDDDFFRDCAKVAHPKIECLKKILLLPEHDSEYNTGIKERTDQFSDDPTHKCFHIFKTWQKFTSNSTYRGLREALDSFSIFRGRYPLPRW